MAAYVWMEWAASSHSSPPRFCSALMALVALACFGSAAPPQNILIAPYSSTHHISWQQELIGLPQFHLCAVSQ